MLAFVTLAVALARALSSIALTDADSPVLTQELIDAVNSRPDVKWTAGFNKRFLNVTKSEASRLLGFIPNEKLRYQVETSPPRAWGAHRDVDSLPVPPNTFDSRTHWPGRIHAIRDQGLCSSCWAYTATSVFSDRIAIRTNDLHNDNLSPQELISCDYAKGQDGCSGGDVLEAFQNYLRVHGVVTETCYPSTSDINGARGSCLASRYTLCLNSTEKPEYFKSTHGYRNIGEYAAKEDIYSFGPISAVMDIYEDIFSYNGTGVYEHVTGVFKGLHAVRVIGWGTENGEEYWLCANTWGTNWGDDGFFKIKRGTNECDIEHFFTAVAF